MKLNTPSVFTEKTHEGGAAGRQTPLTELKRAVSTCLLWENTFYEKGNDIAQRISDLCEKVPAADLSILARRARTDLKLRHVPLFLCKQLARLHRGDSLVSLTLEAVVQRPDELSEFLSIYWKEKKTPLAGQVKKGLAKAFSRFNEYQFSKWDRDGAIKLRDVMFMVHPKPQDIEQAALFKKIADKTLESADTWEVALSAGANKKETFERLLQEKKLGYMALLMNLRNMDSAGVDYILVKDALIRGASKSKALPFRFIAAAKAAPAYAQVLSDAMLEAIPQDLHLNGVTAIIVDVSGSMNDPISEKSTINRWEAAAAVAVLARAICDRALVYTFSYDLKIIPDFRGLPLVAHIDKSQQHGGTYLEKSLTQLYKAHPTGIDRLIVITDEQAHDGIIPCWAPHGYIVNVAPYKPGLSTDNGWVRINGWSERVVDWIIQEEAGEV